VRDRQIREQHPPGSTVTESADKVRTVATVNFDDPTKRGANSLCQLNGGELGLGEIDHREAIGSLARSPSNGICLAILPTVWVWRRRA
jgi:hypothetical protein